MSGRRDLNRAIQGDIVAVRIKPRSEWKRIGAESIVTDDGMIFCSSFNVQKYEILITDIYIEEEEEENGGSGEEQKESESRKRKKRKVHENMDTDDLQPTGQIVGIVRQNWRAYVYH